MADLPYLYGKPDVTGDLRTSEADFKVFELLPFEPTGEGEHFTLKVRKTGANTVFVAKELARFFNVRPQAVTYAGLKDRFAVTEQTFSVHLPGKGEPDLSTLDIEGVEVLSSARHNKKLKTGALIGNRFELTLRNVSDAQALANRFENIKQGVPNYFGEQRFGIDGGNIDKAKQMFAGKRIKDKKKRSIYLSAARSLLFNRVLAKRIELNKFSELQVGDVCMLAGSQSVFKLEDVDADISRRYLEKDIDLTAPLWGRGQLMTESDIQAFEISTLSDQKEITDGLENAGLKQERRRIRLNPESASLVVNDDVATVSFFLPSGCFATTVLRELIDYKDLTQRAISANRDD